MDVNMVLSFVELHYKYFWREYLDLNKDRVSRELRILRNEKLPEWRK